jgi:hypothetical protein
MFPRTHPYTYLEGYYAFMHLGKSLLNNPYNLCTTEAALWDEGIKTALFDYADIKEGNL